MPNNTDALIMQMPNHQNAKSSRCQITVM